MKLKGKRILVCPLDWGLGHASRCVVIINKLIELGAVPVIGADKGPLKLLKAEFPDLEFIVFKGREIRYPSGAGMKIKMMMAVPGIWQSIRVEHAEIKILIKKYRIDGVISDNRFGLYQNTVPGAYMTHQLNIQSGNRVTDYLLRKVHNYFISKYNLCMVPDFEGQFSISGNLSHKHFIHKNVRHVGALSRLNPDKIASNEFEYDFAVILSGPEPQRTIFETKILNQLEDYKGKVLLIRGIADDLGSSNLNITINTIVNTQGIEMAYRDAEFIICRSGYSSLMDLVKAGKKAIIVPTPGQTEQEYLANYLSRKKFFYSETQNEFNLLRALLKLKSGEYSPPSFAFDDKLDEFFEEWAYFFNTSESIK
jgi:uncharacterized protein (TIGR00661 family)